MPNKRAGSPKTIGPYRCGRCRVPKAVVDFPAREYGRAGYCLECDRIVSTARRDKDRTAFNEYQKKNRAARIAADAATVRAKEWAMSLRSRFGIEAEQYAEMWDKQGGVCGLCQQPEHAGGRRLAVDHDHSCCPGIRSCGKCVRGLLCLSCNTKLGFYENNSEKIHRWIEGEK